MNLVLQHQDRSICKTKIHAKIHGLLYKKLYGDHMIEQED
jgi:hypothetical protein